MGLYLIQNMTEVISDMHRDERKHKQPDLTMYELVFYVTLKEYLPSSISLMNTVV